MYRLAVFLGAVILAMSPGVASASTALLLGGRGKYSTLTEDQMTSAFGGYFATYDRRVSVPFPGTGDLYGSVAVGTDNLYAAVYDPAYAGPKTIGGVSEGAPAVMAVLRRLQADLADQTDGKEPPPPTELNVAIYGSPSKRWLGKLADLPVPVTPYDIIIVKAEYDGLADFPDRTSNLLAVTNAILGGVQLHVNQSNFDIRNIPTKYTVETNSAGGTTTTILIPTEVLPILRPMVALHFSPERIARMDARLRPKIDSAYDRPAMQTGIPPNLTGPPGPAETATAARQPSAELVSASSVPAEAAQPKLTTRTTAATRAGRTAEPPKETDTDRVAPTPSSEADDSDGSDRPDSRIETDSKIETKKAVRHSESAAGEVGKPRRKSVGSAAGAGDKTAERTTASAGDAGSAGDGQ